MQKRKKLSKKARFFLLLCPFFAAFLLFDLRLQELALRLSRQEVSSLALTVLSEAVSEAAAENPGSLILLNTDSDKLSFLQTDMEKLTCLMNSIAKKLTEKVRSLEGMTVSLPVGSLTGSALLSGRGPGITCRLVPFGELSVRSVSRFESAGINQTRHQILLQVKLQISVLTAFRSLAIPIQNEYTLSDTVLIGEVPESYTYLLREDSRFLSAEKNTSFP